MYKIFNLQKRHCE